MHAAGGVDYMKTLDRMKVSMTFTSLLVIQPRRKASSACIAGLLRLSRVLM